MLVKQQYQRRNCKVETFKHILCDVNAYFNTLKVVLDFCIFMFNVTALIMSHKRVKWR